MARGLARLSRSDTSEVDNLSGRLTTLPASSPVAASGCKRVEGWPRDGRGAKAGLCHIGGVPPVIAFGRARRCVTDGDA
jgi:hypothetical protein